jgi:hypothetical protein
MRKDIEGQGLHTGEVIFEEIRIGDSAFFSLSEDASKGKLNLPEWKQTQVVAPRAAASILMTSYPNSIFNERNESVAGSRPAPLSNWQQGFGVLIDMDPGTHSPQKRLLLKVNEEKYVLLQHE